MTPTVTGLTPSHGPDTGGTSVTITGTGFPGATSVRFGSTAASFTIVDATHLTATAPAGTAGIVDVTVSTAAGTSTGTLLDHYTYTSATPAPTVAGVSPGSGPTAGGTVVTISGTDLTGATAVKFGPTAATGYTVVDATHITAIAPAGAAGTVDVTVFTAGGTNEASSADRYTYVPPTPPAPTVTSVSPNSGTTAGGSNVTISGTNLTGATAVKFGATAAAGFTVTDSGHITAVTPAESVGTVDITVTTGGGTSAIGSVDQYTYATPKPPTPTVTKVLPNAGPTTGGTKVTITGTNLTGATAVKFGGHAATTFTVTDSGHITAKAPAEAAGTVDITVTTAGGTSATGSADRYRYLARPHVTALSVRSGPKAGGTKVVITGSGFTKGAVVRFGTKAATVVSVKSSTRIVVRTPRHAGGGVDVVVSTVGGTSRYNLKDRYTYT